MHLNIHSIQLHIEELRTLLGALDYMFDIIAISEIKLKDDLKVDITLKGYHPPYCTNTEAEKRGTILYVTSNLNFKLRKDLEICESRELESSVIETINNKESNDIVGVIYRHPKMDTNIFIVNNLTNFMNKLIKENIKKVWQGIKAIVNIKSKNYNSPSSIEVGNSMVTNSSIEVGNSMVTNSSIEVGNSMVTNSSIEVGNSMVTNSSIEVGNSMVTNSSIEVGNSMVTNSSIEVGNSIVTNSSIEVGNSMVTNSSIEVGNSIVTNSSIEVGNSMITNSSIEVGNSMVTNSSIEVGNSMVTNSSDICNNCNYYFSSIAESILKSNKHPILISYDKYLTNSPDNSFVFVLVY